MKFTVAAVALAGAAAVSAQAADQSICDKYSTALLKSTGATEQKTLLTLVVNSALIGNYSNATAANPPAKPSGILTKDGSYNGTNGINLLKYFTGELASTNRNGAAASVNFLDGGAAEPLKQNKASWDNATDSNQAKLITHLYSYFGALLGCSSLGKDGFEAYAGNPSQYDVHKFMNLDANEMGYFIQEVAYSALSFGVTMDDVQKVGEALGNTFNNKCGAPVAVAGGPAKEQSICLADGCPTAAGQTCTAENQGVGKDPAAASSTGSGSGSASPSSAGSAPSSTAAPASAGESLKAPIAAFIGAALGAAALL